MLDDSDYFKFKPKLAKFAKNPNKESFLKLFPVVQIKENLVNETVSKYLDQISDEILGKKIDYLELKNYYFDLYTEVLRIEDATIDLHETIKDEL